MSFARQHHLPWLEAVKTAGKANGAKILSSLKTYRARRACFRRTFAELSQLSPRELADIGIPRSHIRRLASEESKKVDIHDIS